MLQTLPTRYRPLKTFKGGNSIIQKAQDLQSNQAVVLKLPTTASPDAQERIAREARAFQHLGNILGLVKFVSYEENQGNPFLALECLQGTTIGEQLETHGEFSEADTISIGRSLCRIVSKLHARRVIHRDISINNVLLLEGSGDVRLIDLGLALVQRADGSYEPHDTGRIGTPATRAPELSVSFSGDERCDVYSIGKVMYQLANGMETSGQELHGLAPKAKSRVQEALSAVIVRCVKKDPNARYQTVQQLERALFLLQARKAVTRVSQAGGALLLVGGLFAGGIYTFNRPEAASVIAQQTPTATASAPVLFVEASTTPTTLPSEPSSSTTVSKEEMKAPTKQTKPKTTLQNTTKSAPPESLQTDSNEPSKVVTQSLDNEEEETDTIMRARLLKIATEPTPIAKPQPIEIHITTPKK